NANIPAHCQKISLLKATTFKLKVERSASASFVEIDQAIRPPELGNKLSSVRNYLGSFDAITSIFSIEGDFARSSAAFSIKAWATLPFRCASRPESSANVSKIPYLNGSILIPNH